MTEIKQTTKAMTMDDVEKANDIEFKMIPAFGGLLCIKSLLADDMIEWSEANEGEAKRTAGLRLILKSLVDGIPGENGATGKLICKDEHLQVWRKKSHKVTETIVKEILKLNGINVKGAELEAETKAKKD